MSCSAARETEVYTAPVRYITRESAIQNERERERERERARVREREAQLPFSTLISHRVFILSICRSRPPHKSINLSYTIIDIKDELTDWCGNGLLQNVVANNLCEMNSVTPPKHATNTTSGQACYQENTKPRFQSGQGLSMG